jgi:hypothetical protein
MKVVGFIGVPGVGKSTRMRKIIEGLGSGTLEKEGMVSFHLFPETKSVVVGIYDDQLFSGTDRLGMAIAVKFREWATAKFLDGEHDDWTMYWEGQRFSTNPMMKFFFENFDANIYLLEESDEVLQQRQDERGNKQTASFLKGMKTRVENLAKAWPIERKASCAQ